MPITSYSTLPVSYCANVHPGETVSQVREGLTRFTKPLRQRLGFPVAAGLWMTRDAVAECTQSLSTVDELRDWLADVDLSCYTMNAFPFGNFHARRVKENVYLPDWTSSERRQYTVEVADMLQRLLSDHPAEVEGSISTSPCAFKPLATSEDVGVYFPQLVSVARHLDAIRQRTGRMIRLAIEPEPCCVLETTEETIGFFQRLRDYVAGGADEEAVREHLGVCYDVCHQAVEFEDVAESIGRLQSDDIRINKVHITCALELQDPGDEESRRCLARFVEERYLHQTFAKHPDGRILRVLDLDESHALKPNEDWLQCPVWRIHFHVPVNEVALGPLSTTRPVLEEALRAVGRLPYQPHLEVETYTWNVLPAAQDPKPDFDLVSGLQAEMTATHKLIQQLDGEG